MIKTVSEEVVKGLLCRPLKLIFIHPPEGLNALFSSTGRAVIMLPEAYLLDRHTLYILTVLSQT